MATLDLLTNFGQTTVSSGGTTAPAAGTSESWTVASSATFPAASNAVNPQTQFRVVDVNDPSAQPEIMIVTNVSGTTWTVTRGAESSTPIAHTSGFTVQIRITAGALAGRFALATASTGLTLASIPTAGFSITSSSTPTNVGSMSVTVPASGNLEVDANFSTLALAVAPLTLSAGSSSAGTQYGTIVSGNSASTAGSAPSYSGVKIITGLTPGAATIYITVVSSAATTTANCFIGAAVKAA